MHTRIAVATDFSPRSDRALRRAIISAKQAGATLSLMHVVEEDQPQYLIEAQMDAARSMLDDMATTIFQLDDVVTEVHMAAGDVYSGILLLAEQINPSVIILGPHRRQLRDAFTGTTVERTIAHSRFPVLMAAGVPSAPYERVLIALDIDESSKETAHGARGMAILERTEIMAMHAFDTPARGMMHRGMSEPDAVRHYLATEKRWADQQLIALLAELEMPSARRILAPINGTASRTILETAQEEDASLIVVGTSKKTGLKRFILGSVAEDVLGGTDRDVLVIPCR